MKSMKLIFSLVGLSMVGEALAREIRTPLITERGPINELFTELTRECWTANVWGNYYQKRSKEAYNECGDKVPLSQLFFNKANFNGQEAFSQSMATVVTNPLLASSILGPRVAYRESGGVVGLTVQACPADCVRVGFRSNIPIRRVRVCRLKSCGNGTSDLGGQTTKEVAPEKKECLGGATVDSYAYRLDFLSRLPYTCSPCPARDFLIVNYKDADFPPNKPITMSNQDVTNQNGTPVSVIRSTDGSVPEGRFAVLEQKAQNLPFLSSTGGTIPDGGRAQFDIATNYTPLGQNTANQSTLFVVPTANMVKAVAPARIIKQHVDELLACIDQEAEAVFKDCDISFKPQCTSGVGDFDTEAFAGYFFSDCFYGEILAGIKWPTGKRSTDPLLVFKQPLGNNGHYEYKLGIQGLYEACCWASLKGELTWHKVQKRRECIATPFQGARVKNIGLPVSAEIDWDYFIFRGDLIVTPPQFCDGGFDIGYEFYHKAEDTINCFDVIGTDCLGKKAMLDSSVITRHTRVNSHKVRGEVFWNYKCCQLFGGGSHVFSGKNAPRETDWHVGMVVYF